MMLSAFYEKLKLPEIGSETFAEYMALEKTQQNERKGVHGGFMGGTLSGPRRKAGNVTGRDIITLDFDNIPDGGTRSVLQRIEGLDVNYFVHSTRKHCEDKPRLRVLLPFDRTVSADEYRPCALKAAEFIDPDLRMVDPSTFEVSRLMYWPTCCSDIPYIWRSNSCHPFISADGLLEMYTDWRDVTQWPTPPGTPTPARLKAKQKDPETKTNVVGAFCRTYDIPRAIDEFLSEAYEPVDNIPDRYTYRLGSTTGGAVVYDDGKFLYSHHATDPCSGQLVNAFDLVRLHRFGELDDADDVKAGTKGNRLPSYIAMEKYAKELPEVTARITDERGAKAKQDFEGVGNVKGTDNGKGANDGKGTDDGKVKADPSFMGSLADKVLSLNIMRETLDALGISTKLNIINHRAYISGAPKKWSLENTENNLPVYLRDFYIACQVKGAGKNDICDRLDVITDECRYNPVQEAMSSANWDGVDRIRYVTRDILLTTDPFDALLIKKWFWQTMSMALNDERQPYGGDGALVLQGGQGIGKTSFFREICVWPDLFTGGKLIDIRDKDSIIQATENWICELGEMERMTRKDDKTLKAMITNEVDVYRTPYARKAVRRVRRTSFCGTVNPGVYLVDETGNRRYWTVKAENINLAALRAMPEQDKLQLWAQAYTLYLQDPQGFRLTPEEKRELDRRNLGHMDILPGELEIMEQLDFDAPIDTWQWVRPAQIRVQGNVTPKQIGCAIARIARTYGEGTVQHKHTMKGKAWLLPLKYGLQ
jgi:hypothetical protein